MNPAQIRNIALVGPAGAGKSTVFTALLHRSGSAAPGDRHSICLGNTSWNTVHLNLLDTPAPGDHLDEIGAVLGGVDSAVFVISTVHGIDPATIRLWAICDLMRLSRAIVITHVDDERADFDESVAVCRRVFSDTSAPMHYPLLDDADDLGGVVDLRTMELHDYSVKPARIVAAEQEHRDLLVDARHGLNEAAAGDLCNAVKRTDLFPVLIHAHGERVIGTELLLDFLVTAMPSPLEREAPIIRHLDGNAQPPLAFDSSGTLCAGVLSVSSGDAAIVRVFNGTLHAPSTVACASATDRHPPEETDVVQLDSAERTGSTATAGAIVQAIGLTGVWVLDTLSDVGNQLVLDAPPIRAAVHPFFIEGAVTEGSDADRVALALSALQREYVSLRIERTKDDWIVWCTGPDQAHAFGRRIGASLGAPVTLVPTAGAPELITFVIQAPQEFTDALVADCQRRRGVVLRQVVMPGAMLEFSADIPVATASDYPIDIALLTDGTASISWTNPTLR